MSEVHQKFTTELDTSNFKRGASEMQRIAHSTGQNVVREMSLIEQQQKRTRQGADLARIGAGAVGAAQLARGLRSGADASSALAQSAQAASAFLGPTGLIVAGVTAAGAALWESVRAERALVQAARDESVVRERQQQVAARQSAQKSHESVKAEVASLQRRLTLGDKAAAQEERRLKARAEIAKIDKRKDLPDAVKEEHKQAIIDRHRAQESLELRQENRGRNEQSIQERGQGLLDRARESMLSGGERSAIRREQREFKRAQRRIINEDIDREDRARRNESPDRRSKISDRISGLSDEERDKMRGDRTSAMRAAKDPKFVTELSDEALQKILGGIEKLIAK